MLEDSDWSSKGLAEVKLAMSGISPSLLHSIKLKQSAPVKESVAFLTLGGPGQGMLSFLYKQPCLGQFKKRDRIHFPELMCNSSTSCEVTRYIWKGWEIQLAAFISQLSATKFFQTLVVFKWDGHSCVCHINWAGFLPV